MPYTFGQKNSKHPSVKFCFLAFNCFLPSWFTSHFRSLLIILWKVVYTCIFKILCYKLQTFGCRLHFLVVIIFQGGMKNTQMCRFLSRAKFLTTLSLDRSWEGRLEKDSTSTTRTQATTKWTTRLISQDHRGVDSLSKAKSFVNLND